MTASVMTNLPIVNGEFARAEDAIAYKALLEKVRNANEINFPRRFAYRYNQYKGTHETYFKHLKLVVRKRYRGSRKLKKWNKQSMCLKEHANAVSVYIYEERW